MNRSVALQLLLPGAVSMFVLAAALGCSRDLGGIPVLSDLITSDEAVISAVMADVHRGMETGRIYKVLSHVSRNYMDAEGRDYAALEAHLTELLRKYRGVRIERADPRIVVEGDRARVLETFGTRAEPVIGSDRLPANIAGQVMVYLVKNDNQWKIVEWGHLN